ncbi:MAG: hypothetical protein CMI53_01010 [Parcubacteria group bacterium]|jgi:hypothetical protein|nr:hypothetical protein [Parcubacteria group bacterium]|tara:strand:- start:1926 stop:2768 length:843 start_codon:yes stop_codon:yes gene_type:complete
MKKTIVSIMLILVVGVIVGSFFISLRRPSNDRNWAIEDSIMPYTTFDGDLVTIHNIRNFKYGKDHLDITPDYYDKTFDLSNIESAWLGVNPFKSWRGIAHTFVSFGFTDDEYISVSVETRMEEGEEYSPLTGLANAYEIIYQIGDENDIIKVRTNYRENEAVHLYPIKTTPERMRHVFVAMLERTNELRQKPEFYNTLTHNCTSTLIQHVNDLLPSRVPKWHVGTIFPGYSDHLAYNLDMIDSDLEWKKIRDYYYVNDRARALGNEVVGKEFSKRIREFD